LNRSFESKSVDPVHKTGLKNSFMNQTDSVLNLLIHWYDCNGSKLTGRKDYYSKSAYGLFIWCICVFL